MRIWLHGRIDAAPVIQKRADGTFLIEGGIFRYRRWQQFLGRRAPRLFPLFGYYVPLDGRPERICGWTIKQLARRYGVVSMEAAP